MKISFCTQAMNRLDHIRLTLKRNIEDSLTYPRIEFILLDFNSNDDLDEYIHDELISYINDNILFYYKTLDPKYYHNSKAKNLSHRLATGDILVNMDADNYFYNPNKELEYYPAWKTESFPSWIDRMFTVYGDKIILYPKLKSSVGGRYVITRESFYNLGGYDEEFESWGWEDTDFFERSLLLGLSPYPINTLFTGVYTHRNCDRIKNYDPNVLKEYDHNAIVENKSMLFGVFHDEKVNVNINDAFGYTVDEIKEFFGNHNYNIYRRHVEEKTIKVNSRGFQKYKVCQNFSNNWLVV